MFSTYNLQQFCILLISMIEWAYEISKWGWWCMRATTALLIVVILAWCALCSELRTPGDEIGILWNIVDPSQKKKVGQRSPKMDFTSRCICICPFLNLYLKSVSRFIFNKHHRSYNVRQSITFFSQIWSGMKPSESEANCMYSSTSYSNIVRSILYLSCKAETIFFDSWEKSRFFKSPSLSPALVECFLVRRPLSRPESFC